MKRLLAVVLSLLLTGFLAGAASAGGDDEKPQHKDEDGVTALTLYATEAEATTLSPTGEVVGEEEDPTAFAPGARIIVVDTLYSDEARTKQVGRNDILCTFTQVVLEDEEPTSASLLCQGVVQLDDQGSLAWSGTVTFAAPEEEAQDEPFAVVAITGGSGAFTAAGGQVSIFDESPEEGEESLSRYEVELLSLEVDD